ncbi:NRDE family protein [Shewanella sp. A32]|uniref:NRDE family protein n=1 Tax=Shewanella sp. A32 TaxID=3031327 RepID=UPI0023BA295B|nr:NRDE family protein [Shewanella sp. A32]MDF0533445.1 NRDE family protein [Shewanella sp. A32]
MCILFVALQQHPDYPLILCANRDEYHHRPSQAAHFWPPQQQLLAGKDLSAGGSWLGVNRQGTLAAITNIRAPHLLRDNCRSRGELVIRALSQSVSPQWLQQHQQDYNPFNLLYGDADHLYCYNSLGENLQPLTPGFHAISNGALDDIWPKMARGTQALQQKIAGAAPLDYATLLDIMQDDTEAESAQLPDTGIDSEWEQKLSAIFIRHPQYGTRSTSLLLQNHAGEIHFHEVRYNSDGKVLGQESFHFAISR